MCIRDSCVAAKTRPDQALFGIVQGGVFRDLREQSAAFLLGLDLPGYAIGGLAVGESKAEMHAVLEWLHPVLPAGKPRYLMGVGAPEDLVNGVLRGIDIFDLSLIHISNWRMSVLMPPWMTLSPRNMTKRSSPRKGWATLTAWARPSGFSCGM